MKRIAFVIVGGLLAAPLMAQTAPPPAAAPAAQPAIPTPVAAHPTPQISGQTGATTLRGEAKLRYIGRRLSLTADQQKSFDGLLDTFKVTVEAESQNQTAYLTQLKELIAAQTAATESGDKDKAEQIRKQINETRPGMRAEQEFFLNLEKLLTPEQKEVAALLRQHAEKPGGLELTPVYILTTARGLGLTPEQSKRIDALQSATMEQMNPLGGQPPNREAVRDKLIVDVRAVLTPAQQKQYDARIEVLKSRPGDEQGAPAAAPPPAPPAQPGK